MQIKLICILCDTGGKVSYTFPSCVPVDFPASDANPANSPLAEFCVPCVPSGTGGTLLSQPSHKTTQAPCSPPGGPFWPSFTPGGGTDPLPPGQGPVWATQGRVWQKSPERQKSHFSFSASLRLETKGTVVSNPHNPPLWGGQAERLPDVVGRHKRRAGLACRLGRLGAVPTGDPRPCTHFCRKERSL